MSKLSQSLKACFCRSGATSASVKESNEDPHYYTDSELALIRQHRIRASEAARLAVRRRGVTVDPRIAAAKAS